MGAVQLPVQRAGKRCVRNENEVVSLDVVVQGRKGFRLLNWHNIMNMCLKDKPVPSRADESSLLFIHSQSATMRVEEQKFGSLNIVEENLVPDN